MENGFTPVNNWALMFDVFSEGSFQMEPRKPSLIEEAAGSVKRLIELEHDIEVMRIDLANQEKIRSESRSAKRFMPVDYKEKRYKKTIDFVYGSRVYEFKPLFDDCRSHYFFQKPSVSEIVDSIMRIYRKANE